MCFCQGGDCSGGDQEALLSYNSCSTFTGSQDYWLYYTALVADLKQCRGGLEGPALELTPKLTGNHGWGSLSLRVEFGCTTPQGFTGMTVSGSGCSPKLVNCTVVDGALVVYPKLHTVIPVNPWGVVHPNSTLSEREPQP